jgi:heparosan-N-sulfate-glucuronate 5-epimerase
MILTSCNQSTNVQSPANYQELVKKAVRSYQAQGIDFTQNLIDYRSWGSFLHFEETADFTKSIFRPDSQGIPQVKYGAKYYYNPVTIAQYALCLYGKYLRKQSGFSKFKIAVDKLLSLQDKSGAFRFPFSWPYYLTGKSLAPGWVSGMAQGQALSVLARAYTLTKDAHYLDAGIKAFNFLLTEVDAGGVMDTLTDLDFNLAQNIIFEEYPARPAAYTLNGFMFTLLGCYDWWQLDPGATDATFKTAAESFVVGIKTLDIILPYYDIGGFATYDLGYITYHAAPNLDLFYFAVDIYLLHALYSISGDETLKQYERLWTSYINHSVDVLQTRVHRRVVPQVSCGI